MSHNLVSCFDQGWLDTMNAHAVQVSAPGEGMLRLDAVEVGPQHNKPRSNLLLRWHPARQRWEFFVDDDLRYLGDDPARQMFFTGAHVQHWQSLVVPNPVCGDVHEAMLRLLEWLDSPMRQALDDVVRRPGTMYSWSRSAADSPLALDLRGVAALRDAAGLATPGFEPTPVQADLVERIAAAATQPVAACCPLVHGPSGCGKHALARAAAGELIAHGLFAQVLEISGAALAAGMLFRPQRDERLGRVLQAASAMERTLVLVDQFEAVLELSDIAGGLIVRHMDRGLRLIAVARGEFCFEMTEALLSLRRRLRGVRVPPLDAADTAAVLQRRLACHPLVGKVALAAGMVPLIVRAARSWPGANPGAALDLAEALLSRAAWNGADVVGPDDLWHLQPQEEDT